MPSAGLLPQILQELLGLQGSLHMRPPINLIAGLAGGAHLATSSVGGRNSTMSNSAPLFVPGLAPGLAPARQLPNLMNAGMGISVPVRDRHYLQLLQNRHDAAKLAAQFSGFRQDL
jgi:hypothetical protein